VNTKPKEESIMSVNKQFWNSTIVTKRGVVNGVCDRHKNIVTEPDWASIFFYLWRLGI